MRLAIMQPYFFPYIGYFKLINTVDRIILFDDVQYIRHGWINRNRILKPKEGWQYIFVPLQKHKQEALIKEVKINSDIEWKGKILRQLEHYRKSAPFYKETITLLEECFESTEFNIAKFNAHCLRLICQKLNIPFKIEISSEMNLDYSNVFDSGDWALRICEQLGATEYLNPVGGKELFDSNKFSNANIKLSFQEEQRISYNQYRETFERGLSILDVMFSVGFAGTKEIIDNL